MDNNDEPWNDEEIFSLTENLSSSNVDPSKLLSYYHTDPLSIGMDNFRQKKSTPSKSILLQQQQPAHLQKNVAISPARMRWRSAALKVKYINDPWAEFKIDSYPSETAVRHRYNAIKKEWIKDECTVKIETKQFANGAMRACFRLKKLTTSIKKFESSWEHASNYVAKCYMSSDIPRERYFEDVKLQMDAKLWAEIFNRHNPPKKIDMFQVSILEFKDRPNSPLYHLEHFIDGKYIKYNSNSGFVEDANIRCTPQAFSHFTFEASNHDLMVVDIQGVGDLYTDPQIHTSVGTDYGDGNLGVKGFALFFSSHVCNDVCRSLGLTQFDMAASESKCQEKMLNCILSSSFTQSRGSEEFVIGSPSSSGEYFRRIRSRSDTSGCSDDNISNSIDLPDISEVYEICDQQSEGYDSTTNSPLMSPSSFGLNNNSHFPHSIPIPISSCPKVRAPRIRAESSCLDSAFDQDEAKNYFSKMPKTRPSCVSAERNMLLNNIHIGNRYRSNDEDFEYLDYHSKARSENEFSDLDENHESILGRVHLELCKYHEQGRFLLNESDEFDKEAALFHLKQAANLGVTEALTNYAKIHLKLPREILSTYEIQDNESNISIGFEYLLQAADKGDKNSIFYIAKAYDTGVGLGKNQRIDWLKAYEYYQKVLNISETEVKESSSALHDSAYFETTECDPVYAIIARMAEMNFQGGHGLEQDYSEAASLYTEAGDKAMLHGKGRLANKYFMLSEEASGSINEE